jgi:hypothetical protein
MRRPHLEFIYRIVADMDPNASLIPKVQGTGISRLVLPIVGGTVRGPQVNGEIVKNSGADWAQRVESPKVLTSHHLLPAHAGSSRDIKY